MFIQYYGTWDQDQETGGAFHPTDLSSAIAIWEADITIEDSGGNYPSEGEEVKLWIDQTSNLYELQDHSIGPDFTLSGINGEESVVYSTTSSEILEVANTHIIPSTGDWHLFCVLNHDTGTSNSGVLVSQGDDAQTDGLFYIRLRQLSGNTLAIEVVFDDDGTYGFQDLDYQYTSYTGQDLFLEVYREGSQIGLVVDDTTVATETRNTSATIDNTNAQFAVGALWNGSRGGQYTSEWAGELGAIYLYSSKISGTDYTDLTDYINTKYGV